MRQKMMPMLVSESRDTHALLGPDYCKKQWTFSRKGSIKHNWIAINRKKRRDETFLEELHELFKRKHSRKIWGMKIRLKGWHKQTRQKKTNPHTVIRCSENVNDVTNKHHTLRRSKNYNQKLLNVTGNIYNSEVKIWKNSEIPVESRYFNKACAKQESALLNVEEQLATFQQKKTKDRRVNCLSEIHLDS